MVDNKSKRSINVRINDNEDRDGTTYYIINIDDRDTGERWIQKSRYSVLYDLHETISTQYVDNPEKLPKFPKKKWMGNRDPGFISQRQKELQHYFNMVVQYLDIDQCKPLKDFLFQNRQPGAIDRRSAAGQKQPNNVQGPAGAATQERPQAEVQYQTENRKIPVNNGNGVANHSNGNGQYGVSGAAQAAGQGGQYGGGQQQANQFQRQQEQLQQQQKQFEQQQQQERLVAQQREQERIIAVQKEQQREQEKRLASKQLQIEKIVDSTSQRFVSLVDNFEPPSEEHGREKRAHYDKLHYDYKNTYINSLFQLPQGDQKNLIHVHDPSLYNTQTAFVRELDRFAAEIERALLHPKMIAEPSEIVHKLNL